MIKVKDGYAKLIGTTYAGSANRVLLSNGGDIKKAVASTADTLVLRDSTGSILHTVTSSLWVNAAKGQGVAINIPNTGYYALSRIKSKTGNFTLSCHSALDNKFVIGYMTDETVAAGTNNLNKTWIFDGDSGSFDSTRINALKFLSTVATGTQPYLCTSTTLNTNLNADLWDGKHWNDLQIGGRNYYKQYSGCWGQTKDSSIKGYIINSSNGINRISLLGFDGYAGHWTVSFEIKADTACTVHVNLCDFNASSAYGESSSTSVTTSYVKHTYVFLNVNAYNTSDSFNGFLDIENSLGIKIYVKNIKIEKGTKATDWSPAPEDLVDLYSELTITGKKNFSASYKNALNIIRSDSTNGNSVINFSNASKTLGYIGVSGSGSRFGEGHPIFDTGVDHFKIWYSENDGSNSGLDADLLDGQHGSYYATASSLADYYKIKGLMYLTSVDWDWDNITSFGTYKIQSGKTISNHPLYNETDKEYLFGLAMVIRGLASDSENRTAQLYIPHNSNNKIPLYIRISNNNIWKPWNAIPSTSYISAKLGSYLPLTGGTMTGTIKSNATTILGAFYGTNLDGTSKEYTILENHKNGNVSLSSASGGLYLGYYNTTTIYCRGNYINIDSGNYTDYTVTKTGGGASGTWGISITGNAVTATALSQNTFNTGHNLNTIASESVYTNSNTNVCKSLINGPEGRSNGEVRLESVTCGSNSYGFQTLYTRVANNYEIWYRTWSNSDYTPWVKALHSGIAYIDNGTITINGTSITPLTQQSLANYVTLGTDQTITGSKIFANNIELTPYNDLSTYSLVFREKDKERKYLSCVNGDLKFGSSSDIKKIWHEGNDGSDSGLDADLLDGVHASGLLTALSSGTTNKVSLTVGGTTKNITTLYASYLCSVGTVNPLTGRTLAYGNVYSYRTNSNYHEGAPTTYTATIGFGLGAAGTVEICGEWTSGRGLWVRALRDYEDDWYAWDRILTLATYANVLDSKYCKVGEYLPLAGGTMTGLIKRSSGGMWRLARDTAIINLTFYASGSYMPSVAMKSASGYWAIGTIGHTLVASYDTDADYTEKNNKNTAIYFPTSGGTLALTSQIPSLTNYYTKDESDNRFYGATINRTANTVLAAPNGSAGVASFRKLVMADMPDGVFKHLGAENKASVWSWGTVSGTSGWSSTASDRGYRGQWGTNLDISGFSTWYHRLAMCTDGRIEYWHGINTKTLTKLGTIAWISDIPTKTSQLTNDSNYVTGGPYIPLSGTTGLSGSIVMQGSSSTTPFIRNFTLDGTSGWAREIMAILVDGSSKFVIGAKGNYTKGSSSNSIEYAYIGCNNFDGLNLKITADSLKWGDNTILHAGNYNFYAPTLTGGGASGTWGIDISGSSDKLDGYHESSFLRYRGELKSNVNFNDYYNGSYVNVTGNGSGNSNNPTSYGYLLTFPGAGSNSYYAGWLFSASTSTTGLLFRSHWDYTWGDWVTIITDQNISLQSVSYATTAGTADSVAWANVTGKPTIPTIPNISITNSGLGNAVTSITASGHTLTVTKGSTFSLSGHTHDNYLQRLQYWAQGTSYDVDDLLTGITFAYQDSHNAPSCGTVVSFSALNMEAYALLLLGDYINANLYFRNRDGNTQVWNNWAKVLSNLNYTDYVNSDNFPGLHKTGTVTSVTAGTGLAGGTITTSGTISINSTYQTYISNGNTAYGWGNHADAGYLTSRGYIGITPIQETSGNLALTGINNITTPLYGFTITTPVGNIQIGPQNTSGCHIYTNKDLFYFNKPIHYWDGSTSHVYISEYNYTSYTPILNSSSTHATKSSVIYAPITSGSGGDLLISDGLGSAPVWTSPGNITVGGASKADKLTVARTIALSGAVTGSASFDGSANITITTSVNHTHSYLVSGSTLSGSSHAEALKTYFTNNKASIPRCSLNTYYSSAMSNGSLYFGYFLSGYDSTPYGGFYVAHYDTPYYVGISYGTFTLHKLAKISDLTWTNITGKPTIPTLYEINLGVNGNNWTFSSPYNTATTTIYAPTSAGTSGQVLVSTGGTPTWLTISTGGGYIGTTPVLSSEQTQNLTGIGGITANSTIQTTGSLRGLYVYVNAIYGNTSKDMLISATDSIDLSAGKYALIYISNALNAIYTTRTTPASLGLSNAPWGALYAASGTFTGNISANGGSFYTNANGAYWTSDARLKTNIVKARNLDIADLLVEFDWKDSGNHSWGYIAQDLLEVLPEAVSYSEDTDRYSVNYNVAHSAAIASLTARIKELEEKLKKYGIR